MRGSETGGKVLPAIAHNFSRPQNGLNLKIQWRQNALRDDHLASTAAHHPHLCKAHVVAASSVSRATCASNSSTRLCSSGMSAFVSMVVGSVGVVLQTVRLTTTDDLGSVADGVVAL